MTPYQVTRAEIQRRAAESTMVALIPETDQWLLVPVQSTPQSPVTWEASRLSVPDALAVRASKKLRSDELCLTSLSATRLKMELDRVPLWRGDHVEVNAGQMVTLVDSQRGDRASRWPRPCQGDRRHRDRDARRRAGPGGAHGDRELPDAEVCESGVRAEVATRGPDLPSPLSSCAVRPLLNLRAQRKSWRAMRRRRTYGALASENRALPGGFAPMRNSSRRAKRDCGRRTDRPWFAVVCFEQVRRQYAMEPDRQRKRD
ncbi:hypothetical protein THIOKS11270010 [Thiocapsa sp. KS1]|nr:hypothetical protein THIOKS11270010 [Thiocapsa sp. KS1]